MKFRQIETVVLVKASLSVGERQTHGPWTEGEIALQPAIAGAGIDRPIVIRDDMRIGEIVDEGFHHPAAESHAAARRGEVRRGQGIIRWVVLQRVRILVRADPLGTALIFVVGADEGLVFEQRESVFQSDRGGDGRGGLSALTDDGIAAGHNGRGFGRRQAGGFGVPGIGVTGR